MNYLYYRAKGNKFGVAANKASKQKAKERQKAEGHEKGLNEKIGEVSETEAKSQPIIESKVTEFTDRNKIAEAAKKRQAESHQNSGISKEKTEELRIKREKDELLGKISHYYSLAGKNTPFGLASSPVSTLRKHLEYAKSLRS